MVGFEPTVSGTRNRRIPRLSYTPMLESAPHSCARSTSKSTRRELNPHFRRGMATGCRYITGAQIDVPNCQRTSIFKPQTTNFRTEHRAGLEPTLPHYECGVVPLDHQCFVQPSRAVGPEGLEPSPTRVRAGHAAANTLIPNGQCKVVSYEL